MPGPNECLRIVVLGYIVRGPLGGLTWHHLQYVLGLMQLGHDVYFLEDSDDYPSCYDPSRHVVDEDPTYGLQFATDVFSRFQLDRRWAYYDSHKRRWLGPLCDRAIEICETADVVVNLSGVNPLRPWTEGISTRIFVDTDPVFTQVRTTCVTERLVVAPPRTLPFHTFAENIDRKTCRVPDDGFQWNATRQPVVAECWQPTTGPDDRPYTTVMQWDSYPAVEFAGQRYGMKSDSFGAFLTLPSDSHFALELAVGGEKTPRAILKENGWVLVDPLVVTRTPTAYQDYIESSRGEFSVAKQGYVVSGSGWFSERSTAYLASGRPVVTQDTGFSEWLPTGLGLLSFTDAAEALAALASVEDSYPRHCQAAREIAIEHFDYRRVLEKLLSDALSSDR